MFQALQLSLALPFWLPCLVLFLFLQVPLVPSVIKPAPSPSLSLSFSTTVSGWHGHHQPASKQ